jgi:hypothetical protein
MAAMPRKKLSDKSKDFGIRFGLHLRKLLDKRKLTAPEFHQAVRRAGLDVSRFRGDRSGTENEGLPADTPSAGVNDPKRIVGIDMRTILGVP